MRARLMAFVVRRCCLALGRLRRRGIILPDSSMNALRVSTSLVVETHIRRQAGTPLGARIRHGWPGADPCGRKLHHSWLDPFALDMFQGGTWPRSSAPT